MAGGTREIRAKDIVADIRSGMPSERLMLKYKLTAKGLRSAFRKLLDAKVITRHDILRRYIGSRRIRSSRMPGRQPRKIIRFPLLINDLESPDLKGFVRNVSKKGISVEGMDARLGDLKALQVRSSEFVESSTFEFVAECRWALTAEQAEGEPVVGFLIKSISTGAFEELEKLL